MIGFKLSAGLGIALIVLAGAFKLYYDKSQAELDSFQLQLERSIQNEKILESTIAEQNENLEQTIENQKLSGRFNAYSYPNTTHSTTISFGA